MKRLYHAPNRRICVLVSGGLDSAVLVGELSDRYARVYPVYVRQGLLWENVELYWLRRYLKALHQPALQPLKILSLPMTDLYGKHWSLGRGSVPAARTRDAAVYLPGRNLVLVVKAAIFSVLQRVSTIALGSLGHNPFADATPGFFRLWSRTLAQALGAQIRILTPYRALAKTQVIKRGRRFPLRLSFSCLSPVGKNHCGRCNKCAERQKAFRAAGVPDRTIYAKH